MSNPALEKRCPECHRFGVEWHNGHEQCLWRDCLWVNENDIDLSKVKHPIRFQKFIDAIRRKK
jgi:hypothetical protein